jgi:hypothetical protein
MRVPLCRDGLYGGYNAYQWLKENIGPRGYGWVNPHEIIMTQGKH